MRLLPILLLAVACAAAEPETAAPPRHMLTNDGLMVLARAGIRDSLLVDLIRYKRTMFDTSADALAALARQGLSERVLRAVVEKQEQVQMRKPKIAVNPVPAGGPVELEPGEVVIVPPPASGKKSGTEPERWYKVSMD